MLRLLLGFLELTVSSWMVFDWWIAGVCFCFRCCYGGSLMRFAAL